MISLTYVTLLFSAVSFPIGRSQAFSLCVPSTYTQTTVALLNGRVKECMHACMHDYGIVKIQIAYRTCKEADR